MKQLLQLITAIIYILLAKYVFSDHIAPHFVAEAIFIFTTYFVVDIGYEIYKNHKQLWFVIQTKIFYYNTEIRYSLAYVYRIKIDGKYLLVKNRKRDIFQPVGGVYKTLPGSERIFDQFEVKPDRMIETQQGVAKGDLRVHVLGKYAVGFLKWFNSKEDREVSPWREFCEELLATKILDWHDFSYIDYKYKGTVRTPIIKLDSGEPGIFIHEVFDLIPNDKQTEALRNLLSQGNTAKHIWVDEYLINRLGHDETKKEYVYEISPHTKWALNLKYTKG